MLHLSNYVKMLKSPDLSNKRLNSQYLDSRAIGGPPALREYIGEKREKERKMSGHSQAGRTSQSDTD